MNVSNRGKSMNNDTLIRADGRIAHFFNNIVGSDIVIDGRKITVNSLGRAPKQEKLSAIILGISFEDHERDLLERELLIRLCEVIDSFPEGVIEVIGVDPRTEQTLLGVKAQLAGRTDRLDDVVFVAR